MFGFQTTTTTTTQRVTMLAGVPPVGTFAGSMADKYGRRLNCVMYGVVYCICCVTSPGMGEGVEWIEWKGCSCVLPLSVTIVIKCVCRRGECVHVHVCVWWGGGGLLFVYHHHLSSLQNRMFLLRVRWFDHKGSVNTLFCGSIDQVRLPSVSQLTSFSYVFLRYHILFLQTYNFSQTSGVLLASCRSP